MSLSGLRPWPEERLAEFGRRQYYGLEAGADDAQGRIDRCARVTAVLTMSMPQQRAPAVPGNAATLIITLLRAAPVHLRTQWNIVCRYHFKLSCPQYESFLHAPLGSGMRVLQNPACLIMIACTLLHVFTRAEYHLVLASPGNAQPKS